MSYVRLDRIEDIVESVFSDVDLLNGAIVTMVKPVAMDDGGEAFQVSTAVDVTDAYEKIMLHVSVPIVYDNVNYDERDFVLEAGEIGRAYVLRKGNSIISVSEDMMAGGDASTFAVGDIVVPVSGSFMLAEAAITAETIAFTVIDTETLNDVELVVLQLL